MKEVIIGGGPGSPAEIPDDLELFARGVKVALGKRLAPINEHVQSIDDHVRSMDGQLDSIGSAMHSVDGRVDTLSSAVQAAGERVHSVDGKLDGMATAVNSRFDEITKSINNLTAGVNKAPERPRRTAEEVQAFLDEMARD
jgi:prefoldin subunit 5